MATQKVVTNLVINRIKNQEIYNYLAANGLINEDELYFVEGNDYAVDGEGLPEVSTADAGKVLTVGDDGTWSPAELNLPDNIASIDDINTAVDGLASTDDVASAVSTAKTEMTEYVDSAIANNVAAPFVFSDTAPSSLKSFWIDTANGNLLKAYNTNTSSWEAISSVFA